MNCVLVRVLDSESVESVKLIYDCTVINDIKPIISSDEIGMKLWPLLKYYFFRAIELAIPI